MLYEWAALGFKEHFPTDINVLGSYVKPYRISMVMCGMNTLLLKEVNIYRNMIKPDTVLYI